MFVPRVRDPTCEKERTAAGSLRMNTKSVISSPICPPTPPPKVAMADGADQVPSPRRATTTPDPPRAEPMKPNFAIVRMARPWLAG